MKTFQLLTKLLLGKVTTIVLGRTEVRILHDKKVRKYALPQAFQEHNYLHHPEDMATWLQAALEAEHIRVRRCRLRLDGSQIYLQTVVLPGMAPPDREKWIRWESGRYVPFEPGTYQAALIPWQQPEEEGNESVFWQDNRQLGDTVYLLAALATEKIDALKRFAEALSATLTEITPTGPGEKILPVNLLPEVRSRKKATVWGCKIATVTCVAFSIFFSVRSLICWYQSKSALQVAQEQLIPFQDIKKDYAEEKKMERCIREYREALRYISDNSILWYPALNRLAGDLPDACWLEGIRGKKNALARLEVHGCSENADQLMQFTEKLQAGGEITGIRISESKEKHILQKSLNLSGRTVTAFILQGTLNPAVKEEMP